MSVYSNFEGTGRTSVTFSKGTDQIGLRTNSGRFEFKHYGIDWDEPMPMKIARTVADPTGFPNMTDSEVTYSAATRRFTLALKAPATSYSIWRNGKEYTYTASQSPAAHADTTGVYFFYVNSSGTFVVTNSVWDISNTVQIAFAYYNTDLNAGGTNDAIVCDERHGVSFPWAVHQWAHLTVGAKAASGFTPTGYVLNSDVNADIGFAVGTGDIIDEDIQITIPPYAEGSYTVLYRLNANGDWNWYLNEPFPFKYAGGGLGNIQYNQFTAGAWQLTQVTTNNRWMNVFVCATNSTDSRFKIVCIPSQTIFTTLASAQAASITDPILSIAWGSMPFQELAPLYQITYRYNTGYGSTGKVRIESFTRTIGTSLTAAGIITGSHNALTGRDVANTHPALAIGYDNTVTLLTAETVQAAIDEVISNTIFKEVANVIIEKSTAYDNSFIVGSSMMDDETSGNQDKRMFFDRATGSFRAGGVNSTQWNAANRGAYSVAIGYGGTASGAYSTVIGGSGGSVSSSGSAIIGGEDLVIATAQLSFMGSGSTNNILNASHWSGIVAGKNSNIGSVANLGTSCFIGGGDQNNINITSNGNVSAIVGGLLNSIESSGAFIGAGTSHSIVNAAYSGIVAGNDNTLGAVAGIGTNSFMGGGSTLVLGSTSSSINSGMIAGQANILNADFAVALGGFTNEIDKHYSIAMGRYAKTHWWGAIAQASGRPGAVSGAAQSETVVLRQTVTGSSNTIMYPNADAGYPLTLLTKHIYAFKITVVCGVSASSVATVGDAAMYTFEGLARNIAGTAVLLTCNKTVIYEDANLAAICDANLAVNDATDALVVMIGTGADATLSLNCAATVNATIVAYV